MSESGKPKIVSAEQSSNALFPMNVSVSGKITLVSVVQARNASLGMLLTLTTATPPMKLET
jgi:hypothetical protein